MKIAKSYKFEASLRAVHKRSISQNMPVWEHTRTSSVILGYRHGKQ